MFNYYIPTRILFGAGKLNELGNVKLPGKKALIVISNGRSIRGNGYLKRVEDLLRRNSVESVVFDKIMPNPIKEHVMEGAKIAKDEGCDFIVGLGGGSSIDSAKSIAVMVKNPGDYWDYINGGTGGGKPVTNGALPIVAITTTAGTGTEVDPWTVITHNEEKIGFGCDETFPLLAIVDPELMLTVPPHLTAYQGFDAFFHAVEGYIANTAYQISDIYALESIRLITKSLPTAVKDGKNINARSDMALANTLSGMVESTSFCTSEHSLEHAMSAYHPALPHGAGLIMLSIAYHSFFMEKIPERYKTLAKAMGKTGDDPKQFIDALKEMQQAVGVAGLKMSDYGITEDELPKIADNAITTMGFLFQMDRYQLSRDEVISILKNAFA